MFIVTNCCGEQMFRFDFLIDYKFLWCEILSLCQHFPFFSPVKEPNNHISFSCQVIEISTQMTLGLVFRRGDGLGAYSVFSSSIVCAPKELGKESSQILLLVVVYCSNFILPAKSVCAQGWGHLHLNLGIQSCQGLDLCSEATWKVISPF